MKRKYSPTNKWSHYSQNSFSCTPWECRKIRTGHLTRLSPHYCCIQSDARQPLNHSFQLNCTSATRNACVQEMLCSHVAGATISIFDRIREGLRGHGWSLSAGGTWGCGQSNCSWAVLLGTSQMNRETAMALNLPDSVSVSVSLLSSC
jgi:hypothetical protein